MVSLDWHAYQAQVSSVGLSSFCRWFDEVDLGEFVGEGTEQCYIWHSGVDEYGQLTPVQAFDGEPTLADGGWYRLGQVLDKTALDVINEQALIDWCVQAVKRLALAYQHCHEQRW